MVKRQSSTSPVPPPSKSPKSAPATPTKSSKKSNTESPSKSRVTVEVKKVLAEKAMDLAYRSLDYSALAAELGIPESALKDQFKPSRSNLRRSLVESIGAQKS